MSWTAFLFGALMMMLLIFAYSTFVGPVVITGTNNNGSYCVNVAHNNSSVGGSV